MRKVVVEFGIPASAMPAAAKDTAGAHSAIDFDSAAAAAKAAVKIARVLFRQSSAEPEKHWRDLAPTRSRPRVTWWAADRSAWVAVRLAYGF